MPKNAPKRTKSSITYWGRDKEGKTSLTMILARSFGFLLLLALIISSIGIVGLINTINSFNDLLEDETQGTGRTILLADEIETLLLQARSSEKNFMLRGETQEIQRHDEYVANISNAANEIVNLNHSHGIVSNATTVIDQIGNYSDFFNDVAVELINRGGGVFGADNGTVGQIRIALTLMRISFWYDSGFINTSTYYQLESLRLDMRNNEKDYLLLHSDENVNVTEYMNKLHNDVVEFKSVINAVGLGINEIASATNKLDFYLSEFDEIVALDELIKQKLSELSDSANNMGEAITGLKFEAKNILEASITTTQTNAANTTMLAIGLLVPMVILCLVFAYFITRNITQPLRELQSVVSQVSSKNLRVNIKFNRPPAKEIQELGDDFNVMLENLTGVIRTQKITSDSVAAAVKELASTSEEVNALSEEIAATIQQISRGASNQSEFAVQGVEEMNVLAELVDKSLKDIESALHVIDGIAGQTNILALNASIEAARAGEFGKGFAVVAENVRRLAEEARGNAASTNELTSKIITNIDSSIQRTRDVLQNFAAQSEEFSASSEEVAAATEEQTAAMNQLTSSAQGLTKLGEKLAQQAATFILEA